MPYSVTGVFQNNDVTVAQADNINSPLTYNNYNLHAFSSIINTIGFDWKIFQGTYLIMDDLCYFIRDQENNIWRLTFTAFDGTSTGNIEFNTELIASTEIQDLEAINTFKIYPNPVSNGQEIQLIYELQHSTNQGIVKLYDISGREVYSSNLNNRGLRSHSIATNALSKGLYTISINIDGVIKTDHIVIN